MTVRDMSDHLRLWSDEIEFMRPEARASVADGFGALGELLGRSDGPEPAGVAERVDLARSMMEPLYITAPEGEDREIAGIRCRVFVPDGPARAVYLHYHGGGMMTGQPEMNDIPNLSLSQDHQVAVVSVDYRLAPEHPYPAGPDDGLAVASWLVDNAESEFGSARLLTGGESAGGYMAAMTLLRARDELGAVDRFDGANLVFGVYDWGRSPSQRGIRPHDGPDVLDPARIEFFTECYLPGLTDDERRHPTISPAFADLRDLPPSLVSVGSTDHLLDDSLLLAARAAAAGGEVELFVAPDLPHGFIAFPCGITTRWFERTAAWFTDILDRPPRAA